MMSVIYIYKWSSSCVGLRVRSARVTALGNERE